MVSFVYFILPQRMLSFNEKIHFVNGNGNVLIPHISLSHGGLQFFRGVRLDVSMLRRHWQPLLLVILFKQSCDLFLCCSQRVQDKAKKNLSKKEVELQKKKEKEELKKRKEEEKRREREEKEEKKRKEEENKKREQKDKDLRRKHKV